ncbi:ABC transporter [Colletotrichum scovillei]|uniref:ABC transporter n=1 Tax=Colletotrichum scovillei TaxID=1209932 RepID=A0A9P7REQ6_9PEZI|nr:ABC transporter [Colletotrichum scovillei]KAG7074729.1 ABC transporter [Colletotrichum scovillei]KAG7081807.1 ABC transporter [Colletotrichum scovillei]
MKAVLVAVAPSWSEETHAFRWMRPQLAGTSIVKPQHPVTSAGHPSLVCCDEARFVLQQAANATFERCLSGFRVKITETVVNEYNDEKAFAGSGTPSWSVS